jgi:hypothetical protein
MGILDQSCDLGKLRKRLTRASSKWNFDLRKSFLITKRKINAKEKVPN